MLVGLLSYDKLKVYSSLLERESLGKDWYQSQPRKQRGMVCLLVANHHGQVIMGMLHPSQITVFFSSLLCGNNCRCSGPHARYTDKFNEFNTLLDRAG